MAAMMQNLGPMMQAMGRSGGPGGGGGNPMADMMAGLMGGNRAGRGAPGGGAGRGGGNPMADIMAGLMGDGGAEGMTSAGSGSTPRVTSREIEAIRAEGQQQKRAVEQRVIEVRPTRLRPLSHALTHFVSFHSFATVLVDVHVATTHRTSAARCNERSRSRSWPAGTSTQPSAGCLSSSGARY